MKYEKPQKGNPHQLTVRQHCFPKRSIDRFVNAKGVVHAHLIASNESFRLRPSAILFCASRVWDQRAERGFMKEVEDAYQELADDIVRGRIVRPLSQQECRIVTDMYCLWNIRFHWKTRPLADQQLSGILDVSHKYTKDDQEILEKNDITAIRPDGTISGRNLTGLSVQSNMLSCRRALAATSWGILKTRERQFIVPDSSNSRLFMPVNPQLSLTAGVGYRVVTPSELSEINKLSQTGSKEFFFAQNLRDA